MKIKKEKISIELTGIKNLMFDRFISMDGKGNVSPEEKFYFDDDENFCFPSINIMSFLSAELSGCATKSVVGRKWKGVTQAIMAFCEVLEDKIVITNESDAELNLTNSDWYVHECVAKVKKTGGLIVPSPKQRPVIPLPWKINFSMTLIENETVTIKMLKEIFEKGGLITGLGTYRPIYGKFMVTDWRVEEI